MYDGMIAETVQIVGDGGDVVPAYTARPLGAGPFGGVVVIHHMPGYDDATKEIVRRFAFEGFNAICPHLHHREAPGAAPDDAAAANRNAGGVPDDRLVGDVGSAAGWLRRLPNSNGRVGTIGYCSGGRQSFLAACRLPIDAAVDCYGAFVVGSPPPQLGIAMEPIIDLAGNIECPILGLFGNEDQHPSPEEVDQIDARLTELGKEHEFHRFDGAGHAFFSVDRPSYRPEVATEAWRLVLDFYGRHLSSK